MARHLLVVCLAVLSLVVVGLACGAPANPAVGPAGAQATDVRRTEAARVQNIISNPSTATPLPAPTATPSPTCPNAIWWTEARTHVGELRSIQGTVVGTRAAPAGGQLLEVGLPYPDPLGLAIVLASGDASALNGKTVCATGQIQLLEGRPTLQLHDATGVKLVD
ncbi:MAG: hypothetical protein JO352_14775 [Chloroflexi bacterium]|nr:hypothetical protein [Chloroflexota bacterium]